MYRKTFELVWSSAPSGISYVFKPAPSQIRTTASERAHKLRSPTQHCQSRPLSSQRLLSTACRNKTLTSKANPLFTESTAGDVTQAYPESESWANRTIAMIVALPPSMISRQIAIPDAILNNKPQTRLTAEEFEVMRKPTR